MTELEALLEEAKKKTGSHYKTAKAIGVTPNRLNDWRQGRVKAQPEDHALIAAVAGMNAEEALIAAVLEKHRDTPKGERLVTALGKAMRAAGGAAMLATFGSVAFLGREALEQLTTMYRTVKCRRLGGKVKKVTVAGQPGTLD